MLWLGTRYVRWATTSFMVTNERLIIRRGILRRSWREILLDRLTDISCRQTLGDRLLGCGDILLESPGRDGQEVFPGLPHPLRIQKEIYRLINERRLAVPTGGGGPSANAARAGAASNAGGKSGAVNRCSKSAGKPGAVNPVAPMGVVPLGELVPSAPLRQRPLPLLPLLPRPTRRPGRWLRRHSLSS